MEKKYIQYPRTLVRNESRIVPQDVKEKAFDLLTNDSSIDDEIKRHNKKSLFQTSKHYAILYECVCYILNVVADSMKKGNIKSLYDVPGFVYDRNKYEWSFQISMDKFKHYAVGEFAEYLPLLKQECLRITKDGNRFIWCREKKRDANGKLILDQDGKPVQTVFVRYGRAIDIQFKSELDVTIDKEVGRLEKLPGAGDKSRSELEQIATQNILSRSANLQKTARIGAKMQDSPRLPRESVIVTFSDILFRGIYDKSDFVDKSVFNMPVHLQIKIMEGIKAALNLNIFGNYSKGFLCQKKYRLDRSMARDILLYILDHDNGHDYVYYDNYEMAQAAFPSFIDSSKPGYISPDDAMTMRWCIFKVCVIYSIMLCNGSLDGCAAVPVYELDKIWQDPIKGRIRLVHSNRNSGLTFDDSAKVKLRDNLIKTLGKNVIEPMLVNGNLQKV